MNRDEMLDRALERREPWDLIVVGGGATGVGIALDAAARGHAVLLLERGDFARVLVVPVYEHAFHKPLAPFEHRVAMCRLCVADTAGVSVSDVEKTLPRPSFTVRTLERIASDHPDWRLRFPGSSHFGRSQCFRSRRFR